MKGSNKEQLRLKILSTAINSKGGVAIYSLFKTIKVPMPEFMAAIFDLQADELAEYNGDRLTITEKGIANLLETQPDRNRSVKSRIPARMQRPLSLDPDAPYIPSRARLDKSLFKTKQRW